MSSTPAIITDKLTRFFDKKPAVNDLDLEIPGGEVFGLLGHNGAGKTTTIRLLAGLLAPSSGIARVLGLSPVTDGPAIRARVGVLTESPAIDDRLTGRENLTYFADLFGLPERESTRRIDELLGTFGLLDRVSERVSRYSVGMRQQLALARTLLHDPELLFLDEPTSGLDPIATRHVHDMIAEYRNAGRAVLLCTHNLEEAERLCDRVAVLEHGQLIAMGSPRELSARVTERQLEIEIDPTCSDRARCAAKAAAPWAIIACNANLVRIDGLVRMDVPRVISALSSAGVPVYRVSPRVVALEDVYFALHGEDRRR